MLSTYLHDPDATLDYSIEWSAWLAGDTLASSAWVVPAGLTLVSETSSATQATAWITGGVRGKDYLVTCRVTTAAGRTDDRSLMLQVRDR